MANCCQNVRGNKTNKDQNDNKKQTNKQTKQKTKQQQQNGRRGCGLKKQLTEWSSDVVIIIDLSAFCQSERYTGLVTLPSHKASKVVPA